MAKVLGIFGRKKKEEAAALSAEDPGSLEALDLRLTTILPKQYQDCEVEPVSMGSAPLQYGSDGKVAWDEIWGSFCDLAMAGGPPHKGMLLEPGTPEEIAANPRRYSEVTAELCRGIDMIADLPATPSAIPGWITVSCGNQIMAEWLVRAIVMENISVRHEGRMLHLPAGPGYRMAKEIKNVITAFAKTSHYWLEHMWPEQHRAISSLFSRMAANFPLVQPAVPGHGFEPAAHDVLSRGIASAVSQATGLRPSPQGYAGWLGFECPDVRVAIWMMRALNASNVLSRREGTTLFVPINPASDPQGDCVGRVLIQVHSFAVTRGVL